MDFTSSSIQTRTISWNPSRGNDGLGLHVYLILLLNTRFDGTHWQHRRISSYRKSECRISKIRIIETRVYELMDSIRLLITETLLSYLWYVATISKSIGMMQTCRVNVLRSASTRVVRCTLSLSFIPGSGWFALGIHCIFAFWLLALPRGLQSWRSLLDKIALRR